MAVDVWDREWTDLEAYRGANANMHTVEALLAVRDATGDDVYLHRALRIVERIIHVNAKAHGWLAPEHFDENGTSASTTTATCPPTPSGRTGRRSVT